MSRILRDSTARKPLQPSNLADTWPDLSAEREAARACLWAEQTGRSTTPQYCLPDEADFLDPEGDFSGPRYDGVFERPLVPGQPVELTVFTGEHATVIGIYRSVQEANDVAFRAGTMMFALKNI